MEKSNEFIINFILDNVCNMLSSKIVFQHVWSKRHVVGVLVHDTVICWIGKWKEMSIKNLMDYVPFCWKC